MNLFDKAKTKETPKTTKVTNDKVRVKPSGMEQSELFETIKEMAEIQRKEKALKAKFGMLSEEVKSLGKEEFVKLFEDNGVYPGSFMLEADGEEGEVAQVMFLPTDRYIKINEDQSKELVEEFGSDIVTEDTTFKFNNKMLEKYGEEISAAIMNSDIPDKDKSKVVESVTTRTVAKGTIEKMDKYGDVESVLEKIKPVMMLKGSEVIS